MNGVSNKTRGNNAKIVTMLPKSGSCSSNILF